MTRRIDYYFSLVSPWAYIGQRVFADLARRHGATVVYKPVLLTEVFAQTGGLPLGKRHPGPPGLSHGRIAALARKARTDVSSAAGALALRRRSRPIGRWSRWPRAAATPAPFVPDAFDGGLGEPARPRRPGASGERLVARPASTPRATLAHADLDAIRAAYERNRLEAIAIGAFGSPCYVLDGEVFWGQDRLELLDDALASGRAPFVADVGRQ